MKNFKVWLVLALVFLAGFAGGVVATRVVTRRLLDRVLANPDLVRAGIERDLNRELSLEPAQREKVHLALAEASERLKVLRKEFHPRFAAILQDARSSIAGVLTPDQQTQFDRFQAKHQALLMGH